MNLAGRLAWFTGKKLENEEARKIFDEYRVFRDFSSALHILMLTTLEEEKFTGNTNSVNKTRHRSDFLKWISNTFCYVAARIIL